MAQHRGIKSESLNFTRHFYSFTPKTYPILTPAWLKSQEDHVQDTSSNFKQDGLSHHVLSTHVAQQSNPSVTAVSGYTPSPV
jgi:hypothetical protein